MDMIFKVGIGITVIMLLSCTQSFGDPCLPNTGTNPDGYTLWAGAEKRSTAYQTDVNTDIAICDRFIDTKWYRVKSLAGEKMPETCISNSLVCQTVFPIWMDGIHPTSIGTTVIRTAYVSNYLTASDCQWQSLNIKVSLCADPMGPNFFIYYLPPTSGCDMGYCFGNLGKCPAGTSSATGYGDAISCLTICASDPITQVDISVHEGPTVTLPSGQATTEMEFRCNFNYAIQAGEQVNVVWFLDDEQVLTSTVTTGSYDTLSESDWIEKHRLGFDITCTAQHITPGTCIGGLHETLTPFFAGVKILNSPITIKEGQTKNIEIQLTVPFLPPLNFRNNPIAYLAIASMRPPTTPDPNAPTCVNGVTNVNHVTFDSMHTETPCSVQVTHTSQGNVLGGSPVTLLLPVTAETNGLIDGTRQRLVKLDTYASTWHKAWAHYSVGEVQIIIEDIDGPAAGVECASRNDPHMTTFDGVHYDHHFAGEYILYKHVDLPIQVNTFFTNCNAWGNAKCNCAVAIQAGRDVLVFDKCGAANGYGNVRRNELKLGAYGCDGLGKGLKVVESGNQYKVYLPTGGVVIITKGRFLTVVVRPAFQDKEKTEGLCGNWNNDRSDDMDPHPESTLDFRNSWRVDTAQSLYRGTPRDNSNINLYGHVYCKCSCSVLPCTTPVVECDENTFNLCGVNSDLSAAQRDKCWDSQKRKKRDTLLPDFEDEEEADFDPGVIDDTEITVSWPTSSGITEQEARDFCEEGLLTSKQGEACKRVSNVGYPPEQAVEDCILDIMYSDSFIWIETTKEDVRESCATAISKNLTLYEADPDSGVLKPPVILKDLCPGDCSGNGDCSTGSCQCFDGFFGSNCSKNYEDPPTIYSVVRDGLCDHRARMCQSLTLKGENFFDSSNLTCHLQPVQVGPDSMTRMGSSMITDAVYEYSAQVRCPIPAWPEERISNGDLVKGFLVSVSNDGKTPGSEYLFVRYDPACEACNITTQRCTKKTDVCKIDGLCFDNGYRPDWDECAVCDITESKTDWTIKKDTKTCQSSASAITNTWKLITSTILLAMYFAGKGC